MKLENISKNFGEKRVFENFSLEIKKGSHVAVLGDSGRGKTTLVKILMGLLKPDGGTVETDGEVFSALFQEDRLLPSKTLLQNLKFVGTDEASAKEYLKKVGLENEYNSYPASLSGGMKRRAALARALSFKSFTALILDEPFTGQDEAQKDRLIKLITEETAEKTLILITHSKDDANALCDTFIEL